MVKDYIQANWPRSICRDSGGSGFRGIDLPFPYTSPCIQGEGNFSFFFYWDTYFTNLGLLHSRLAETARDNIRNILWFIRRHGYMPNHVGLFNRSQPPYLCQMVADYFAHLGGPNRDPAFFRECCEGLRQEYHFWTTARHSPTGLQRHGHHDTAEGCIEFHDTMLVKRLGKSKDAPITEKIAVGWHHLAEAETGWDFTPRFSGRCLDHNPADLNGLLHTYETFLGAHAEGLGWDDAALWQERAAARIARKFVATTNALFAKTGRLWEKTDAVTGDVAGGEYDAAPMLGWTAGVYLACSELIEH